MRQKGDLPTTDNDVTARKNFKETDKHTFGLIYNIIKNIPHIHSRNRVY